MKMDYISPKKVKGYVVWFFLQKRTAQYTPECNKKSSNGFFSRLPSLMATDKPCPLCITTFLRLCAKNATSEP